jgi:hypothetical protein
MADRGTASTEQQYLREIRRRLEDGLARLDQHHRLRGRRMSYRVSAPRTIEIVFHDVARIEESELLGLKKAIGAPCYCSVEPQTAETLTVRVVVTVPEPS